MAVYQIKNLSFTYPNRADKALDNISLTVSQGEFICLCGKSGCGKTTLLRLLKSTLAPSGNVSGEILFMDKPLSEADQREQTSEIGFVMQSPDNQIVTDKVWHELAFGLESLGYKTPEIRTKVAEMASFFGIGDWFHKKVTELSGGQKQLLNLASVMVMNPSVLILDEPTSQLDPIAADDFLKTLEKINRELGVTVILSEHRLEEVFPMSGRVIVMEQGNIIVDDKPSQVGEVLKERNHDMYSALPTPMRVYHAVSNGSECPLTVRDGRVWLEAYAKENPLNADAIPKSAGKASAEPAIELKDLWFRYEKDLPDVMKGFNLTINKGELFAILGGNGTGKTTALSVISGLNTPYRGEVLIHGENPSKISNLYSEILGVLPQNPQSLFVKKTVYLDLLEILSEKQISDEDKEERIREIAALCRISDLLESHPYDLSGGEQQRAALAKVLLKCPEILLLDEPTKGFDAHFKQIFADILLDLKANGVTIVMVSHDIEFCAEFADRCSLFFDGNITAPALPREFFAGNRFYTTAANRMARTVLPSAVLAEDIVLACGGKTAEKTKSETLKAVSFQKEIKVDTQKPESVKKPSNIKIIFGSLFTIVFAVLCFLQITEIADRNSELIQLASGIALAGCFICFLPKKDIGVPQKQAAGKRGLSKRMLLAGFMILLSVPLTIYIGSYYLGDRKYYFISLLIILQTLIPFCMMFEGKKPRTRELMVISVLCAIAVASRIAFFMLPQFKPILALIIIIGVCFGGETGFLVGAVTGFVSNFYFGQGPWTPWQMFAFGIIGYIAGLLFKKGLLRKSKLSLSIFGFIVTVIIYGGIMNPASVITFEPTVTIEMILASYVSGFPFDLIHAASTAYFLWFLSEPMAEKFERAKMKYGLIEK